MSMAFSSVCVSLCVCVYAYVCVCLLGMCCTSVVAEEGQLDALSRGWLEREAPDRPEMLTFLSKLREVAPVGSSRPRTRAHPKAPQFMLDLFDALADTSGTTRHAELLQGNVVRSFQHKGQPDGAFHYFHVKSVGKNEKVIRAEFRWYRKKLSPPLGTSYGHHFYKVDLYEVLDSKVHPWRGTLITSRILPAHTQGWEVFNITQTVCKWVDDSSSNNGLLLVTSLPSGLWVESPPAAPGTSSADAPPSRATGDTNAASTRATGDTTIKSARGISRADSTYLVVFSDDRKKASVSERLSPGQELDGDQMKSQPLLNGSRKQERRRRSALTGPLAPCHRRSFYVDFQKIGWSSWIIAPRGYNAYHCQGSCPFPLSESLRATNHAMVQSIVHTLRLSRGMEDPCCVPDGLDAISLLFYDDEENVVLKPYQDMVAVSCGCH